MIRRFCDLCGEPANERLLPIFKYTDKRVLEDTQEPYAKFQKVYIDIRACVQKQTSPRTDDVLADICNKCMASQLREQAEQLEKSQ